MSEGIIGKCQMADLPTSIYLYISGNSFAAKTMGRITIDQYTLSHDNHSDTLGSKYLSG